MKFDGDKLKQLRLDKGFTKQTDFADAIGVSQNSISRWESGISEPEPDYIDKLCKVLKTQRSALFVDDEPQEDIRSVIREEITAALRSARIEDHIPSDIAEMLGKVNEEAVWDAIRAILKPYLRLRSRR